MLGQFVTDHPLLGVADALSAQTNHDIAELDSLGDGDLVTVGGIIGAVSRKYTKREAVPGLIETDRSVLVTGRIDLRGRELQIRASDVREPDLGPGVSTSFTETLVVDLSAAACTPVVLARLKELFLARPGSVPVLVRFVTSEGVTPLDEVGPYRVAANADLIAELRSLLGDSAARLERDTAAA